MLSKSNFDTKRANTLSAQILWGRDTCKGWMREWRASSDCNMKEPSNAIEASYQYISVFALSCFLATGCVSGAGPDDHDDHHGPTDTEVISSISQATTCGASVARYPVAGTHNNGYDSQWYNFACTSNGSTTIFNSDFISGSHLGNDIFAARGTPVQAAVSGWVPNNFYDSTGGNVVYIQDDCGWTHYYAHLDSISISGNQYVSAGTILGTVGNTGSASGTEPHLHYSIYPDGVYSWGIDPAPYTQPVEGTACGGGGGPPPGGPPAQATGLSPDGWVNVGSSSVPLSWNASSGATSYDITFLWWNGSSWQNYYTWNTSNTYFTVWPVYHDTYYAWTVKAKNSYGQAPQSAWAYFYLD